MPTLLSLTFDFREHNISTRSAPADEHIFTNDTVILNELANSALAWSKVRRPSDRPSVMSFQYLPQRAPSGSHEGRQQQFNHALIALDEEVPWPLQRFFAERLDPNHISLDLPVTGLPSEFFTQANYKLRNTYAFHEDKSEQISVVLMYQRLPRRPTRTTLNDLQFIMTGLSIRYLRLGCRHIDSRCLNLIPTLADQILTLDLAFTDPNPERVVSNLDHVLLRCPALYTVAIAISPLHDRDPNDPKPEKFFKRNSVSMEVAAKWKPFWDKVDEMNASGVKVWEGEVRYRLSKGLNADIPEFRWAFINAEG